MKDSKIEKLSISYDSTLLQALTQMDKTRGKLLIISSSSGQYLTLISIGDIQRSIIKGHALSDKLSQIYIEDKIVASSTDSIDIIKSLMKELRAEFMPVLDKNNMLVDIIFWNEIDGTPKFQPKIMNDIPVVVMAGGKGTRLKPITNVIPKPLIPIGEKTILEEIIYRFESAGSTKFYLSVNYKNEMIKYYLDSVGKSHNVEYFHEDKPLGTAGSLSLLKGKLEKTFYVTNCDILIDQDLNDIYDYHIDNRNEITIVAVLKQFSIPYGTIDSGVQGLLESIQEKPDLCFKINAGVYMLEAHLLEEIPSGEFFHITDLIENVRKRGGRVGVFPISEKSWLDIGEWPEYIRTVKALSDQDNFIGISDNE